MGIFLEFHQRRKCEGTPDVREGNRARPQVCGRVFEPRRKLFVGLVRPVEPGSKSLDRASQLAQQAVALDDSLPNAHILLSNTYLIKRQYEQAIAAADRASYLDPNSTPAYR